MRLNTKSLDCKTHINFFHRNVRHTSVTSRIFHLANWCLKERAIILSAGNAQSSNLVVFIFEPKKNTKILYDDLARGVVS